MVTWTKFTEWSSVRDRGQRIKCNVHPRASQIITKGDNNCVFVENKLSSIELPFFKKGVTSTRLKKRTIECVLIQTHEIILCEWLQLNNCMSVQYSRAIAMISELIHGRFRPNYERIHRFNADFTQNDLQIYLNEENAILAIISDYELS